MEALNLQIIAKPQDCLEMIVAIGCKDGENASHKMGEMCCEILDRLRAYGGAQQERDVKTEVYDRAAFYVRTSGIPDYIWFVLRAVMERPEFRFSIPYTTYIHILADIQRISESVLTDYGTDLGMYIELEQQKQQAVAEERFEAAAPIRDRQRKMRNKVYVAE